MAAILEGPIDDAVPKKDAATIIVMWLAVNEVFYIGIVIEWKGNKQYAHTIHRKLN